MKKQFLRVIALLLAFVMIFAAGCGGGSSAKTLSGAVSDTIAIQKATFEGEITFDMPMDTMGIKGLTFTGAIDRGDYDFTVEIGLKKAKGGSEGTYPSYGVSGMIQEVLGSLKGSIITVSKTGGYLYVDFSPLIQAFGDDLGDAVLGIYYQTQDKDYEEAKEAVKDAKLDEIDSLIALITFAGSYYYDDIEEVIEEMEDNSDDIDEIRDAIADIEKAAGIKVSDLLKATGIKVEIGSLSKDAKAAIAVFEKALVEMIKAAEDANEDFVTVDKKAGSYEWEIDSKNVKDVLEPVIEYLSDNLDDLWDAWSTICNWSVKESALPGNVQKVLEKVDEGFDLDVADGFEDMLDEAYDQMTDKDIKKDIKSSLKDAKSGLKDFADNMKENKVTIGGTYTLTGGKGKRVATCEAEVKAKGDNSGSISVSFTLTEGSAKIEEPGNPLDIFAVIDKADFEEIMNIIEDMR